MSREEQQVLQQIQFFEAKQRELEKRRQRKQEREAKRAQERPAWIKMMQQNLPECMEFHPTEEEFADPIRYITAISPLAAPHGACKIIPPASFRPDCVLSTPVVQTKLSDACPPQQTLLHQVQFEDGGTAFQTSHKKDYRTYTLDEYKKMGAKRFREVFGDEESPGESAIETEFWHTMSSSQKFSVQYANDVEGTACGDAFGPWNLARIAKDSLLDLAGDKIPGVNTPMLYVGILFAHFCWHYEDNALFSINYMHEGSPKIWYTVPGEYAGALESAVKEAFSSHPDRQHPMMKDAEKLLMRKTVMCAPSVLMARGVPVYRCVQRPREFIVTFPRGYHSGFNTGFHLGEAVNFAMVNWIPYGFLSLQRYRASGSMSCLDMERVLMRASEILSQGVDPNTWCYDGVRTVSNIMSLTVDWMERLCDWVSKRGWAIMQMERPWAENPLFIDRQLCGACNHICHLCYVQPKGNRDEMFRFCPEHAGFLRKGPKEVCLRHTPEELRSRALELQRAACGFGKALGRSEHLVCTHDECLRGALRSRGDSDSMPSVKYLDAVEIAKEDGAASVSAAEAAALAGVLCLKCEDGVTEGQCEGMEMRESDYVVRGIGGGFLAAGPRRVHSRFSEDLGVTQESIPLAPFYFIDRFPMVDDLLQKETSRALALFRKCLLEEKPAIARTVPALPSLVVEHALRENLAHVASVMPRMHDPGPYQGCKWRWEGIVADEKNGTLRLRVRRDRRGETSPVISPTFSSKVTPEPLRREAKDMGLEPTSVRGKVTPEPALIREAKGMGIEPSFRGKATPEPLRREAKAIGAEPSVRDKVTPEPLRKEVRDISARGVTLSPERNPSEATGRVPHEAIKPQVLRTPDVTTHKRRALTREAPFAVGELSLPEPAAKRGPAAFPQFPDVPRRKLLDPIE